MQPMAHVMDPANAQADAVNTHSYPGFRVPSISVAHSETNIIQVIITAARGKK
jgi:hypothetical protein